MQFLTQPVAQWLFQVLLSTPCTEEANQFKMSALVQLGALIHDASTACPPGLPEVVPDGAMCRWTIKFPFEKTGEIIDWVFHCCKFLDYEDAQSVVNSGKTHPASQMAEFELLTTFQNFHGNLQALMVIDNASYVSHGPASGFDPVVDVVEKKCYLLVSKDSKTVALSSKAPIVTPGQISVAVHLRIPLSLFDQNQIVAKIILPEGGCLSKEATVDLKQAIGMSYGGAVNLIVEPVHGKVSATDFGGQHP